MTSALQRVDWHAVAPLLSVTLAALLVLLGDLFVPHTRRAKQAAWLAAVGLGTALAFNATLWRSPRKTFCLGGSSCSYVVDKFAVAMSTIVLVCALAVVIQGLTLVKRDRLPIGEYHHLLLIATAGAVALGSARDLLTLVVALEALAVPSFVLTGLRRRDPKGSEGAMIYFLVSVLATAVTLYGASLVYGVTGALDYSRIANGLAHPKVDGPLPQVAIVLTLVGLLLKVSAVPFHTWTPPAYDAAPLPVAAFLSTASKVGGFAALVPLLRQAFEPEADTWGWLIAVVAVATLVVGSVVALRQDRVIRLFAWSSVVQAGFILAPFAVAISRVSALPQAQSALVAYVGIYALTATAGFAAITASGLSSPTYEDLRGWIGQRRVLALSLALSLVSLAGAPPGFAGLWAKVGVIRAAIDGRATPVAIVMAVATVVGLAYYLRLAAAVLSPAAGRPAGARNPASAAGAVAVVAALGVLVIGVLPGFIFHLSDHALLLAP